MFNINDIKKVQNQPIEEEIPKDVRLLSQNIDLLVKTIEIIEKDSVSPDRAAPLKRLCKIYSKDLENRLQENAKISLN